MQSFVQRVKTPVAHMMKYRISVLGQYDFTKPGTVGREILLSDGFKHFKDSANIFRKYENIFGVTIFFKGCIDQLTKKENFVNFVGKDNSGRTTYYITMEANPRDYYKIVIEGQNVSCLYGNRQMCTKTDALGRIVDERSSPIKNLPLVLRIVQRCIEFNKLQQQGNTEKCQ